MIEVKQTTLEIFEAAKALMKKNDMDGNLVIDRLDQSMVLMDRQLVLGFGSFTRQDQLAFLDTLVLSDQRLWKSMGDGLVKAMLNMMDLRGVKEVYVLASPSTQGHYEDIGFVGSDMVPDKLKGLVDMPVYAKDQTIMMETRLPEFFDTACRSKK